MGIALHSIPSEGPVRPALTDNQKLAVLYLRYMGYNDIRVATSPTKRTISIEKRDGYWGNRTYHKVTKRNIAAFAMNAIDRHYHVGMFEWSMVGLR